MRCKTPALTNKFKPSCVGHPMLVYVSFCFYIEKNCWDNKTMIVGGPRRERKVFTFLWNFSILLDLFYQEHVLSLECYCFHVNTGYLDSK